MPDKTLSPVVDEQHKDLAAAAELTPRHATPFRLPIDERGMSRTKDIVEFEEVTCTTGAIIRLGRDLGTIGALCDALRQAAKELECFGLENELEEIHLANGELSILVKKPLF